MVLKVRIMLCQRVLYPLVWSNFHPPVRQLNPVKSSWMVVVGVVASRHHLFLWTLNLQRGSPIIELHVIIFFCRFEWIWVTKANCSIGFWLLSIQLGGMLCYGGVIVTATLCYLLPWIVTGAIVVAFCLYILVFLSLLSQFYSESTLIVLIIWITTQSPQARWKVLWRW